MFNDVILPEVTRFVVKVPIQLNIHQVRLSRCLNDAFPAKSFSFEMTNASAKTIALVPIMEDCKGRAHLCRAPERSLVYRIYETITDCLDKDKVSTT